MNADTFLKLQQLRGVLAYHKEVGIDAYNVSADIDTFLGVHPDFLTKKHEAAATIPEKNNDVVQTPKIIVSEDTIAELCDEIMTCQSCDLGKKRIIPVCGAGGKQVRLLIAGSWLSIDGNQFSDRDVFGKAEDQMLEKMITAINLSSDETFVTNVIKCGIALTVQPQAVHIETCLSYLERQIALIAPDIICTMGTIATRSLLKLKQPLSQLRGTFHEYRLNESKSIPVMPTYHPSYLLKNPEMKRPTWSDLQSIQKKLAE